MTAPHDVPGALDGAPVAAFPVPIESGHILTFARAIDDPNPAYSPLDGSGRWRPDGVLAPPTFAMVADQFDPDFPRRPRPGERWPDSMRPDEGGDPLAGQPFHVEQRFDYHRHVVSGETLTARRLPVRSWVKQGRRGGRLEFIEAVTELVDGTGLPVVTATWLDVCTEVSHASLSTAGAPEPSSPPAPTPTSAPGTSTAVLAGALTPTRFVMYAAAAGDYHPLHHDDTYSRQHGYPGVFAPGMLTMGMTGRAVTDRLGDGLLTQFRGRLSSQVWPGDTLTVTVVPATDLSGAPKGIVEVAVRTYNQRGVIVFDGSATARSR